MFNSEIEKLTNEENGLVPKRKYEDNMSKQPKFAKTEESLEKQKPKIMSSISLKSEDEKHIDIATEYNPAKSNYHPLKDACWNKNDK